jgi:putative oxidoreductase
MKKFLSTHYSEGAFNFALLFLRVSFGLLMLVHHGMDKLQNFSATVGHMPAFMGLSPKSTTILVVFAEAFCSIFVIMGLFTRLAVIPLIITMLVAVFSAHGGIGDAKAEMALHYLVVFLVLLMLGSGKWSVDQLIGK